MLCVNLVWECTSHCASTISHRSNNQTKGVQRCVYKPTSLSLHPVLLPFFIFPLFFLLFFTLLSSSLPPLFFCPLSFFCVRVSHCISGWPGTYSIAPDDHKIPPVLLAQLPKTQGSQAPASVCSIDSNFSTNATLCSLIKR